MLRSNATRAAGFTLIEMVVTMTVFAVLVTVGIPSMRTWVANNKVRAVSDSLQNGLRMAKVESLRSSRQVVFALTNSSSPTSIPIGAAANATSWVIYTLPSMTDGTENPTFIESGVLANASAGVVLDSGGIAAICFNSVGRMIATASASLTSVTGGAVCTLPAASPALRSFALSGTGADRPLNINVSLGGQVHMCDPSVAVSASHPEGC